ncbi:hypothetical protein ACU686_40330 [Yinghuangia aomiensis]
MITIALVVWAVLLLALGVWAPWFDHREREIVREQEEQAHAARPAAQGHRAPQSVRVPRQRGRA